MLRKICISMIALSAVGAVILVGNSWFPKKVEASPIVHSAAEPGPAPMYVGTVNCGAYDVIVVPHDSASIGDAREAADRYVCPANPGTH